VAPQSKEETSWFADLLSSLFDYILGDDAPKKEIKPGSPGRSHRPKCSIIGLISIAVFSIGFLLACAVSSLASSADEQKCNMSYMSQSYIDFPQFSPAKFSKYALHLYREQFLESTNLNGIPVIFIPGNAGSFRQVRSIAAEAAYQYHDSVHDEYKKGLDFFTVDFGEDLTAFHGQTLLDQAEYLNEAIQFILSLYQRKRIGTGHLNLPLPPPSSVIVIGHSMGGMVVRTMFTMPNYRYGTINTILTFAAPHTLPPVSFDSDIVRVYESVNKYWREAFSQDAIGQNKLANVAVVSIAGGILDQMIPSDHATVSSMIPASNGFTVFTSTIPFVWSGIDHQAIIWCDQLRKVVAGALLEIVDARNPSKTKALNDRMRIFRQRFLSGLETIPEPNHRRHPLAMESDSAPSLLPDTLLLFNNRDKVFVPDKMHIELGKKAVYLMPLSVDNYTELSLLTNQPLIAPTKFSSVLEGTDDYATDVKTGVYALMCRYPMQKRDMSGLLSTLDISGQGSPTGLICKNLALHVSYLPSPATTHPLAPPGDGYLSYAHYNVSQLADYDFLTVVDTSGPTPGSFLVSDVWKRESINIETDVSVWGKLKLHHQHPLMVDISLQSIWSSLWAYTLKVCIPKTDNAPLFVPFVRQHIEDPHESKYYLNLRHGSKIDINMHSVAPFSPFNSHSHGYHNLHIQIWADQPVTVEFRLDILASIGKLVLHYRIALSIFPICIVAIILAVQFDLYGSSGAFVSFGDASRIFVGTGFIWLLLLVTGLPLCLPYIEKLLYLIEPSMDPSPGEGLANAFGAVRRNQFFLGLENGHLWMLGPILIVVSTGLCQLTYFLVAVLVHILAVLVGIVEMLFGKRVLPSMGSVLLALVLASTFLLVPYQLAFVVVCIIQLFSTARNKANDDTTYDDNEPKPSRNLYNFSMSILMVMVWLLPINVPTLMVWAHNMSLQWVMPIHPYGNVLSIAPIILIAEKIASGKMIPRMTRSIQKLFTTVMLFYIAIYCLVFGMLRSFWLHGLFNLFSVWLLAAYVESYIGFEGTMNEFTLTSVLDQIRSEKGSFY
jgi:glycosylphosphatidylinositol deacylase